MPAEKDASTAGARQPKEWSTNLSYVGYVNASFSVSMRCRFPDPRRVQGTKHPVAGVDIKSLLLFLGVISAMKLRFTVTVTDGCGCGCDYAERRFIFIDVDVENDMTRCGGRDETTA